MRVPIKFTCNFTRIPTTNPTSPLINSIAKGVGQNSSPHQGFQTSLTVLLSVVTKYQIIRVSSLMFQFLDQNIYDTSFKALIIMYLQDMLT